MDGYIATGISAVAAVFAFAVGVAAVVVVADAVVVSVGVAGDGASADIVVSAVAAVDAFEVAAAVVDVEIMAEEDWRKTVPGDREKKSTNSLKNLLR